MITATVGDLLDGNLWDIVHEHVGEVPGMEDPLDWQASLKVSDSDYLMWSSSRPKIYVVRDGDVIFYVGQSDEPTERLLAHVGQGTWGFGGLSELGRTVKDNLPEARTWVIELWTVQECKDALADETTALWRWDKDSAEQAMMRKRRPCLNVVHNENGQRLPDRYYSPKKLKAYQERVTNPPEDLIEYGA